MNLRRFLGVAAEWIHHVAAISLTVKAGGPRLTALYLVAYVLPVYLVQPPRWMWVLSPIGFVSVVLVDGSPVLMVAAAALAGLGRAAAKRPSAWLAGLERVYGLPALLGAAVGAALISSSDAAGFVGAAVLCALAVSDGQVRTGPTGPLVPAVMGAAVVIGMRVLEPILLIDPAAGAVFAIAWAAGAGLGMRWSQRADLRAVAAAPFVGAAAIALMGTVDGPGMLFLWATVAASASLVSGAAPRTTGPLRSLVPILVVCASASAASAGLFEQLPSILWFGAATLLAGGFVSLAQLARGPRAVQAPQGLEPAVAPEPERIDATLDVPKTTHLSEDVVAMAAAELLDALRTARTIRRKALEELRMSMDPLLDVKLAAAQAMDELAAAVSKASQVLATK